jgi:hypothetical protein
MTEVVSWGEDRSLVAGYALTSATMIIRVLLPAWRDGDQQPARWADVAAAFRREPPADGRISWRELVEFPGNGSWSPSAHFAPAAGRFDDRTRAVLVSTIDSITGPVPWQTDRSRSGRLSEIAEQWTRDGFAGRAWTADGQVGIAAPPYADSVVVSGPRELGVRLLAADLEAFPLARGEVSPITTD